MSQSSVNKYCRLWVSLPQGAGALPFGHYSERRVREGTGADGPALGRAARADLGRAVLGRRGPLARRRTPRRRGRASPGRGRPPLSCAGGSPAWVRAAPPTPPRQRFLRPLGSRARRRATALVSRPPWRITHAQHATRTAASAGHTTTKERRPERRRLDVATDGRLGPKQSRRSRSAAVRGAPLARSAAGEGEGPRSPARINGAPLKSTWRSGPELGPSVTVPLAVQAGESDARRPSKQRLHRVGSTQVLRKRQQAVSFPFE
ncbi:hypothetical protein MRX96_027105 [Rhipicephalus microplus]